MSSNPPEFPNSQTVVTATPFTTGQLVDIRRYCGYPQFGAVASSFQSYRFFQAYGTLEYRTQNMLAEEAQVVVNTYLASLKTLESAIVGASANLDTDKAAVWTHNKNEVADRRALYDYWRRELCGFMGVPPGPNLQGSSGAIEFIV